MNFSSILDIYWGSNKVYYILQNSLVIVPKRGDGDGNPLDKLLKEMTDLILIASLCIFIIKYSIQYNTIFMIYTIYH